MNEILITQLSRASDSVGLQLYVDYLNLRSGSYMKLESEGASAFDQEVPTDDPFRAATGYHRIALDVMNALSGDAPKTVIVNVRNGGALSEIAPHDIIEAPCTLAANKMEPLTLGSLPEEVRGLVLATKAYERAAIEGALSGSERDIRKAMLLHQASRNGAFGSTAERTHVEGVVGIRLSRTLWRPKDGWPWLLPLK